VRLDHLLSKEPYSLSFTKRELLVDHWLFGEMRVEAYASTVEPDFSSIPF
jgi:hypothetical protein